MYIRPDFMMCIGPLFGSFPRLADPDRLYGSGERFPVEHRVHSFDQFRWNSKNCRWFSIGSMTRFASLSFATFSMSASD